MTAVNLIPFVVGLVGLESCLKNYPDIWENGPEFNFKFNVNASSTVESVKLNAILVSNITSTLKCRPFSSKPDSQSASDGLQCIVHDAQVKNYGFPIGQTGKENKVIDDEGPSPFEITEQIFEILYADHGIREIKIQLPVSQWRMNMFRSMAGLLDYGFSKFDSPDEKFDTFALENSTIGQCNTHFEITKKNDLSAAQWNSKCDQLKLNLLTHGNKKPALIVKKQRKSKLSKIENCLKSSPYFFGGESDNSSAKIIDSLTILHVAPKTFEGRTINEGSMTFKNITVPAQEELSIRLDSIKPATTEFKRIDGPGVTKLYAQEKIISPK